MTFKLPSRAEHLGSFLHPQAVIEARTAHAAGTLDAAGLRQAEDQAIADLATWEQGLGLKAITDGGFRRWFSHTDFLLQLAGVDKRDAAAEASTRDAGEDVPCAPPMLEVNGRIAHKAPIRRAGYEYLASHIFARGAMAKVVIPSPSMLHLCAGRADIPARVYPLMEDFFNDVAAAYRQEVSSLANAGCRYIQMDDTNLGVLCDDAHREAARSRGLDPDDAIRQNVRLINESFASAPSDMIKAFHLGRGSCRSGAAEDDGYERATAIILSELNVDAFFIEYGDPRAGDFAPLRHLPEGKAAVLGLVTARLDEKGSSDDVRRRIDEAATYAPLEQLALSPQRGFASTVPGTGPGTGPGNNITSRQQADKIRMCVEVVERVWR